MPTGIGFKVYVMQPITRHLDQGTKLFESEVRMVRPSIWKGQTLSGLSKGGQGLARLRELAGRFPLPWSHYVRLLAVSNGRQPRLRLAHSWYHLAFLFFHCT